MKKAVLLLIAFCMFILGFTPCYAGTIDGIWWGTGLTSEVFMIRENAGTIIVALLDMDDPVDRYWEAFFGPFDGTSAHISTLLGGADLDATMTFTDDSTAIFLINSCTLKDQPEINCPQPIGVMMPISKLF